MSRPPQPKRTGVYVIDPDRPARRSGAPSNGRMSPSGVVAGLTIVTTLVALYDLFVLALGIV